MHQCNCWDNHQSCFISLLTWLCHTHSTHTQHTYTHSRTQNTLCVCVYVCEIVQLSCWPTKLRWRQNICRYSWYAQSLHGTRRKNSEDTRLRDFFLRLLVTCLCQTNQKSCEVKFKEIKSIYDSVGKFSNLKPWIVEVQLGNMIQWVNGFSKPKTMNVCRQPDNTERRCRHVCMEQPLSHLKKLVKEGYKKVLCFCAVQSLPGPQRSSDRISWPLQNLKPVLKTS